MHRTKLSFYPTIAIGCAIGAIRPWTGALTNGIILTFWELLSWGYHSLMRLTFVVAAYDGC